MATYSTPESFKKIISTIIMDIAHYTYTNGGCGHTAALEFQEELNSNLKKIASAPLTYSSPWGKAQRRAFFNYKGQYTLIFTYKPFDANSNDDVTIVIFSDACSSRTKKGNTPRPKEITFDADDLLKD